MMSGCVMDSFDNRLIIVNNSKLEYTTLLNLEIKTSITKFSPQIKSLNGGEENGMITLPDSIIKTSMYYEFVKNNCKSCKNYLKPKDTISIG